MFKKKFTLLEMTIAVFFTVMFTLIIVQLITTILTKKEDFTNKLQRANINNTINSNFSKLICYNNDKDIV
jgi:type II secretory pathway component PulJ